MATPSVAQDSFLKQQQNQWLMSQLSRNHQLITGAIQADTKTNSSNTKNTMTAINDWFRTGDTRSDVSLMAVMVFLVFEELVFVSAWMAPVIS